MNSQRIASQLIERVGCQIAAFACLVEQTDVQARVSGNQKMSKEQKWQAEAVITCYDKIALVFGSEKAIAWLLYGTKTLPCQHLMQIRHGEVEPSLIDAAAYAARSGAI
jgi:hypothetical protein